LLVLRYQHGSIRQTVILAPFVKLFRYLNNFLVTLTLKLKAELWIQKKYYVMVQEATKVFEKIQENVAEDLSEDIDDFVDFKEVHSKIVIKLCKKYYGEEWVTDKSLMTS